MRRLIAVLVVLLLAGALAKAHVVIPAEFKDVVGDASLIVRGHVTDVRSVAVPGTGIDSIATVAVENVLKGQASGFIYVRVPGGALGRTRVTMVGAPTFQTGQRFVLFLRPSFSDSSFRPVGLTMGVYAILPEPKTQRLVVEPPVVANRTTAATGPVVRGDRRRTAMAVSDFESLVRLMIATPPGKAVPVGKGGGGR